MREAGIPCEQPAVSTWDAGCEHEHVTPGILVCRDHEWRMTTRPWTCAVCARGHDAHMCRVFITRRDPDKKGKSLPVF